MKGMVHVLVYVCLLPLLSYASGSCSDAAEAQEMRSPDLSARETGTTSSGFSSLPENMSLANYTQYENTAFGFALTYPQEWLKTELGESAYFVDETLGMEIQIAQYDQLLKTIQEMFSSTDLNLNQTTDIRDLTDELYSLDSEFQLLFFGSNITNAEISDTVVDGVSAIETDYLSESDTFRPVRVKEVVIKYQDIIYIITFSSNPEDYEKNLPEIDKIIESITINDISTDELADGYLVFDEPIHFSLKVNYPVDWQFVSDMLNFDYSYVTFYPPFPNSYFSIYITYYSNTTDLTPQRFIENQIEGVRSWAQGFDAYILKEDEVDIDDITFRRIVTLYSDPTRNIIDSRKTDLLGSLSDDIFPDRVYHIIYEEPTRSTPLVNMTTSQIETKYKAMLDSLDIKFPPLIT